MLRDVAVFLTEQINSYNTAPSGDFDNTTTERVYKFQKQYRQSIKNAIEPSDPGLDNDGYLIDFSLRSAPGYDELTVKFSERPPNGLYPAVRINMLSPNYYINQVQGNIPLWQMTNDADESTYFTAYNYNLATNDESSDVPGWAPIAQDLIIPDFAAANYKWISEPAQLPSGWRIILDKEKQGVEEQFHYDAVLREEIYVRSAADIAALSPSRYLVFYKNTVFTTSKMISLKKELYGFTGEWLAIPSNIDHDGDVLKITNTYYNAKSWDANLYPNRVT